MRRALNEHGFWLMVFGTVIITMLLFAGNGNCADKRDSISQDYGALVYTVEFETTHIDGIRSITYYHLIGPKFGPQALVGVTHRMPNKATILHMLRRYLVLAEGGV